MFVRKAGLIVTCAFCVAGAMSASRLFAAGEKTDGTKKPMKAQKQAAAGKKLTVAEQEQREAAERVKQLAAQMQRRVGRGETPEERRARIIDMIRGGGGMGPMITVRQFPAGGRGWRNYGRRDMPKFLSYDFENLNPIDRSHFQAALLLYKMSRLKEVPPELEMVIEKSPDEYARDVARLALAAFYRFEDGNRRKQFRCTKRLPAS
jgi:hypothetical protein